MWNITREARFLPTCLFNITPKSKYENYQFITNNTLTVDIYNSNGTNVSHSIIQFPTTKIPMNILQWTQMINDYYANTHIGLPNYTYLSEILSYEWTDYIYNVGQNVNNKNVSVKTIIINNVNHSTEYTIQLSANVALLLLFGKSIGSIIDGQPKMIMGTNPFAIKKKNMTIKTYIFYLLIILSIIVSIIWLRIKKVNRKEKQYAGITSFSLILLTIVFYYFMIFKYIRKSNNNIQKIVSCGGSVKGMKVPLINNNIASFTIPAKGTYSGMPNEYANENICSYCVKQDSSERWLFINADTDNSHPLHFHMTSGFADINNENNSACIANPEYNYNLTYSKDVYSIGALTSLLFYTKFANYNFLTDNNPPYFGYSIHCHFLLHHDMAMMSHFGVYDNREKYFNTLSYKNNI
jgi:heme/copper-type cytochrome/quinol oxidase subunit 4